MFTKYRIPQILGILTLFLQYSCSLENPIPTQNIYTPTPSEVFYKGSYMAYVTHQETYGNVIFKENGVA
jgi:arabinogalactan endo-1,4-beta-galactosidase